MYQNLKIFQTAQAMSVHAGQRQAILAQNVANADTPGYIGRDIPEFKDVYAPSSDSSGYVQRASREGHMHGGGMDALTQNIIKERSAASPNGNAVSVEAEMLKATDAMRQHSRSLAIYKSAMTVLRASLGR